MIHELIRQLVIWIYQHPTWAGFALFLLSAGESMTLIGSFIPGTIVMTAVGIFIGAELLPYWPMVLWAACGTLVGDALNFTFGYYLKDNIKNVWPFKTRQHWLTKGQYFFEEHGGKSIYFARFIGPLRAFAPIIAGAMRMSPSKFYLIDTLSAFTWAIMYLLPGVLLGEASLELSPDITEHLFRFVFLTLVIIIVAVWAIRLLILHINDVVKNALSCLWTKIKETPSLQWMRTGFRHHKEDHPRGQLGTIFVLLVIAAAFFTWTMCVYLNSPLISVYNSEIYHFTHSLRTASLDKLMLFTTLLGEKHIIAVVLVGALAWMMYQRCWRAACFLASAVALGVISTYILKNCIHYHRPNLAFEALDGFSYPSGHVVISTIFYGGLAYLIASKHSTMKYRWIIYTAAIILISAIACSRAFLGAHWLSDVVGGILLGWLSLLIMAFFYQRHAVQDIDAKKLIPALIILQAVLTIGYAQYYHENLINDYQLNIHPQVEQMTIHEWRQQTTANIPSMATNRFGVAREFLNIQWAGNQHDVIATLKHYGWKSALEQHNWVLEIQHPEEEKIPTIHVRFKMRYVYDQKASMIYYKAIENMPHTFMVLQLWKTNIELQSDSMSLFVGILNVKTDDKKIKNNINDKRMIAEFTHGFDQTTKIDIVKTDVPVVLIQSQAN